MAPKLYNIFLLYSRISRNLRVFVSVNIFRLGKFTQQQSIHKFHELGFEALQFILRIIEVDLVFVAEEEVNPGKEAVIL